MTRGLVLGKFAPLHRGHQSLIEESLRSTDETVVLVYDSPEVTRIPLARRAEWVRRIYPGVRVIEGHGAPAAAGRDAEIMRLQEDYIRGVVSLPVTHFFSSEWYGDHVSRSLGARDERRDRALLPISATMIREDPYRYRQYLDPVVYRDHVSLIAILGAESTGKTTVAQALAGVLDTEWMPELGRDYWTTHRDATGKLTQAQLVELAELHRQAEDERALLARKFLIVDTNAITTLIYSRFYHSAAPTELQALAAACRERYLLTFVCEPDFPYVEDGTRAGAERRMECHAETVRELQRLEIAYRVLRGPLDQRVREAKEALQALPRIF